MILIKDNPYRTIGLLVGATLREQERQVKRLKQYLEAEQDYRDDSSFPILGTMERTVESINEAASELNLDNDKLNAALFWFYNGNAITDDAAFEALKHSDMGSAQAIWVKLTSSDQLKQKNVSAFQNLSTLFLCNCMVDSSINHELLEQGISLKMKLLESDFADELITRATDVTFKTTKKKIQLDFLTSLQHELEKQGGIASDKFIEILSKLEFTAKDDFFKSMVQKPIEQIEKSIETAKAKRKANIANAAAAGKELYHAVSKNLLVIKHILAPDHIKYTSLSDKVSDEILQCSLDHFKHYNESDTDPGDTSMDLIKKAESFAVGKLAQQSCRENMKSLREWMDNADQREKQKLIIHDFKPLHALINKYGDKNKNLDNAKQLLKDAKPYLANIKSVSGGKDELYLGLSTRVALEAQDVCILMVNALQERIVNTNINSRYGVVYLLHVTLDNVWEIMKLIKKMDLTQDFKNKYNENRKVLSDLFSQLAQANTGYTPKHYKSEGCYIATMAYGNYNHPQVMELRKFRDSVLTESFVGRFFIHMYYRLSPKLVVILKDCSNVNRLIRNILNLFIRRIQADERMVDKDSEN